jgi:glycosyltransferase involved in cell wall biosynthesis
VAGHRDAGLFGRDHGGLLQRPPSAVLAIVPAHNEAGRIGSVVQAVTAQGLPVLVVDDGSSDGTGVEATAAGARVLRLEPNRGKGAALKAGFRAALAPAVPDMVADGSAAIGPTVAAFPESAPVAAAGEWAAFLTLDGDGQHDPNEIPRLLDAWEESGADLVVGMRDYREMPPIRWFTNSVSRLLFSWALGEWMPDNQSGYRVHSRRVAEATLSSEEQGFAFEVEEIAICVGRGYKLAWVPIKTIYGTERSDIKPWTHFSSFIRVTRRARSRVREERRHARSFRRA